MSYNIWIGIFASAFTATSLIPQLLKILREKKSEGMSFVMLAVLFVGLAFWIYYGILQGDWIIIVSNSFALAINILTAILMWVYRPRH